MAGRQDDMVDFATQLLELINGASTTSTYKYALLMALIDLCQEGVGSTGGPRGSVTTRQVVQRVLEIYWPQVRPHGSTGGTLRQLNGRAPNGIADYIADFRSSLPDRAQRTPHTALTESPKEFERLLDKIEWVFIRYPIPLLQRVGRHRVDLIYTTTWDVDVRGGEVSRYQRCLRDGADVLESSFDNAIRFLPRAEEFLASLAGLLRPLIRREWTRFVAVRNGDELEDLDHFLFDPTREDLAPVRRPLIRLQEGKCFYCRNDLNSGVDVDHFLPWSRCGDDQLHNLVAAHRGCNNAKLDHLAGLKHLRRWKRRIENSEEKLSELGRRLSWPASGDRSHALARALYLRQSADSLLWVAKDEFESFDPQSLAQLLAG